MAQQAQRDLPFDPVNRIVASLFAQQRDAILEILIAGCRDELQNGAAIFLPSGQTEAPAPAAGVLFAILHEGKQRFLDGSVELAHHPPVPAAARRECGNELREPRQAGHLAIEFDAATAWAGQFQETASSGWLRVRRP